MQDFITWFFYFTIYAFLGYICEVVYVAILTKKITNRGYLYGPIVPIYGYGAIIVLLSLWSLRNNPFLIILLGGLLTSGLEYFTSFFMELIFHMRWWDYSDKFLNINGRVCLRNSLMFMGLVLLVIYLINPFLNNVIKYIMDIQALAYILAAILFVVFVTDIVFSNIKNINISKIILKLDELKASANNKIDELKVSADLKKEELSAKFDEAKVKFDSYFANVKDKLTKVSIKYPSFKLIKDKKRISLRDMLNKKNKD